jgi:hypothetical protein
MLCLSPATTRMSKGDWYTTSNNTNVAESAHAYSQRDGTRLTLVSAVLKGKKLDSIHFDRTAAIVTMGVRSHYGDSSSTGRAGKNAIHAKAAANKKAKQNVELKQKLDVFAKAQELVQSGVDMKVVNMFLEMEVAKLKENGD